MSAFNRLAYNLAPFNIQAGGEVWLKANASVHFSFAFAGETFFCKGNSLVRFNIDDPRVDSGRMFRGIVTESITSDIAVDSGFNFSAKASVTFTPLLNLSQRVYTKGTGTESITGDINVSQDAHATGLSTVSVENTKTEIGQLIFEKVNAGEVFLGVLDVISLEELTCEFPGLILKPGDTLIVDSSLYNVLLNGENAIHYQNGDWIDNVSRLTDNIIVTGTNAGNLSVQILYTERFL